MNSSGKRESAGGPENCAFLIWGDDVRSSCLHFLSEHTTWGPPSNECTREHDDAGMLVASQRY